MKRLYLTPYIILIGIIVLFGFTPVDSTIAPVSPQIIDSGSVKKPQYGDRVKIHMVAQSQDGKVFADTDTESYPVYISPGKSLTMESIQKGLFMVGVNGKFRVWIRLKDWPGYLDKPDELPDILIIDVTVLEIMGET